MREIKFRAWDADSERMFYSEKDEGADGFFMIESDGVKYGYITERYNHEIGDMEAYHHIPTDQNIMQFTGLHDKNGKEIYEGDLLLVNGKRTVRVEWNKFHACFDTKFVSDMSRDLFNRLDNVNWQHRTEVIGNIHENPELLEP